MHKQIFFFIFSFLHLIISNVYSQCNGSFDTCTKRYDEVAYLTTHNAFNSKQDNFLFPNQESNIIEQLNSGVRGLMLDVYDNNGKTVVYHAYKFLGSNSLSNYLNDIKFFLDNNPHEIITIILECYTTSSKIEDEIARAGLMKYVHSQNIISPWPKLQTMINSNKRLVILSDKNDANSLQNWYHYVWDFAVENKYGEINCDYNRGNPSNSLFIFNHFVTSLARNKKKYKTVNSNPFFINHVSSCKELKNKFPNFITIDFYEIGNGIDVVNKLNSSQFNEIIID